MSGTRAAPEIVVVPNCLRGHASTAEVADALAVGVRRVLPHAKVVRLPLADGGDGTLDVVAAAGLGTRVPASALDAAGRTQQVTWLALDQDTALVESAQICGLGRRTTGLRPLSATSAGVGEVLRAVVAAGHRTVLLALGGTAIVDGGAGALLALGARFLDRRGEAVRPAPARLSDVESVDLEPARALLSGVRLELLPDVGTPLAANLDTFGRQKGLTDEDRPTAVRALTRLTEVLVAAGAHEAGDRFHAAWYGAGGGIGFGLSSVAATTTASGAATLLDMLDPDDHVGTATLAITAEGWVDGSTWSGKLPGAVAQRRLAHGRPTAIVTAGVTGPLPDALVTGHLIAGAAAYPVTGTVLRDGLADAARAACADLVVRAVVS